MITSSTTSQHIDVGCYAADTLDGDERAAFEAHLIDCDSCHREVIEFAETSAELTRLVTAVPPPYVRGSVVAIIRTVRPLPPITDPEPAPRARPRVSMSPSSDQSPTDRRRLDNVVIVLVVAAALVLALWILVSLSEPIPELAPDTRALLAELSR